MTTAEALGPVVDALPELAEVLEAGSGVSRLRLLRRIRGTLTAAPTLLILEDVHWADEATLDVLRFLGRRLDGAPLLIVATFRSEETGGDHPLTVVRGDLATAAGRDPDAAARADRGRGAGSCWAARGRRWTRRGCTSGPGATRSTSPRCSRPATARCRPRSGTRCWPGWPGCRPPRGRCVAAAAVLGRRAGIGLLTAVAGAAAGGGGRVRQPGRARGRRRPGSASGTSWPGWRSSSRCRRRSGPRLHGRALAGADRARGSADHRRLAHHAAGCGDRAAVLEHAPRAADRAARLGAHREAVDHLQLALDHHERPDRRRADLLGQLSYECYLTGLLSGRWPRSGPRWRSTSRSGTRWPSAGRSAGCPGCPGSSACRKLAGETGTEIVFEYSPESFHHTELDYALEICEAVAAEWGPTPDEKMIVNLPTTVEQFPPNIYADRIEWFSRNFSRRDAAIFSVHPHNDRGTAVATAELGLMAGAERVEGTLFGNGERTGNVDIVTIALNLLTQGVDPKLDLSQLDEAKQIVEECNELPVHPRHPWAGDLVYTAFSGSHQDAIKKGMHAWKRSGDETWDVPYLPIDPKDVGRSTRRSSASTRSRARAASRISCSTVTGSTCRGRCRSSSRSRCRRSPTSRAASCRRRSCSSCSASATSTCATQYELVSYTHEADETGDRLTARLREENARGQGNGPIASLVHGFASPGVELTVLDYHEHALETGEDTTAAAYIEAEIDGDVVWGVAVHPSIVTASLRAVVNAVNRSLLLRDERDAALRAFTS